MTNVSARALVWCWVALATIAISAETERQDTAAIVAFQRSADSYTFLHRQVERKLGPGATDAQMFAALQDARASAKAGDLFATEIAGVLRTRIASTLRASNCVIPEGPGEDLRVPRINQEMATAVSLPECLSGVLPRLPEELQYRSVGKTLVLFDAHVNLVIDVLPDAFPTTK